MDSVSNVTLANRVALATVVGCYFFILWNGRFK